MLIVLFIVIVFVSIAILSLIRYRQSLLLQQAAAQIASDLTYARNQARRSSSNWTFQIKNSGQYQVGSIASITSAPVRPLPTGVTFGSIVTINFISPYGQLDTAAAGGNYIGFTLNGPGGVTSQVNVVGIGGKVVTR